MADFTVTLGVNKIKVLEYFYPTVADALDAIITRQLKRMAKTVIEKETEYRGDLSELRKQQIIDAIADLPTYAERMAARAAEDEIT